MVALLPAPPHWWWNVQSRDRNAAMWLVANLGDENIVDTCWQPSLLDHWYNGDILVYISPNQAKYSYGVTMTSRQNPIELNPFPIWNFQIDNKKQLGGVSFSDNIIHPKRKFLLCPSTISKQSSLMLHCCWSIFPWSSSQTGSLDLSVLCSMFVSVPYLSSFVLHWP